MLKREIESKVSRHIEFIDKQMRDVKSVDTKAVLTQVKSTALLALATLYAD